MNFVFILAFVECALYQILGLTPRERKEFLDLHNHVRRSVYPPASDMQELEYNENIEKSVNEYLEQCKFEHRKLDGYGENGRLASDSNVTNTVMSWFQERIYFNISAQGEGRCSKSNSKIPFLHEVQCGHYKMMVKSNLKSLGCGYKFCKNIQGNGISYTDSYISFCFYNSGQKDQPYEIGKPCSECSSSYQFCRDDLCVPKSRYDKNSRTCKLKCRNCAEYFDPKNSCLCDCPDGTEGNSCRGTPAVVDENCPSCLAQGLSCNSGTEDSRSGNCNCKCPPEYIGEYCEIRKDQFDSSFYYVVDGTDWRYNMMIPVNAIEFKKSFYKFQNAIARLINEFCVKNLNSYPECKKIEENQIIYDNVLLIPGFPHLLENGSLAIRIFIIFNDVTDNVKQERFVSTTLLREILTNSDDIKNLIENVRKVVLIDNEIFNRSPFYAENDYQLNYEITKDKNMEYTPENTPNPTSFFEPISHTELLKTSTESPINTTVFMPTHFQESSYHHTKTSNSDHNSKETTKWKMSSEITVKTPTSTNVKPTDNDKTTTGPLTTSFQSFTNSNKLSTDDENSTSLLSTTFFPKTTTKCSNINKYASNGFFLLLMLYICGNL